MSFSNHSHKSKSTYFFYQRQISILLKVWYIFFLLCLKQVFYSVKSSNQKNNIGVQCFTQYFSIDYCNPLKKTNSSKDTKNFEFYFSLFRYRSKFQILNLTIMIHRCIITSNYDIQTIYIQFDSIRFFQHHITQLF